jgi:hypothetical protein
LSTPNAEVVGHGDVEGPAEDVPSVCREIGCAGGEPERFTGAGGAANSADRAALLRDRCLGFVEWTGELIELTQRRAKYSHMTGIDGSGPILERSADIVSFAVPAGVCG